MRYYTKGKIACKCASACSAPGRSGGHLAAKFAAAGHAVSVVARGANLGAIKANGIALREGARTIAGRVIGAVAYSSNVLTEPGVVVNHTEGRNMLVVGETDDRPSPRIEALRAVRERLLAERRAIARAHGILAEGAPRRPGGAQQTAGATGHKPSMLQDYELGRPMEIDAILAVPCAFARAAGVAAPTLEALAAITARLAARKGL